jgi:hypothetical protein
LLQEVEDPWNSSTITRSVHFRFCRMDAPSLQSEKTCVKVENNEMYVTLAREDTYFVETCIPITGLFQWNSCLQLVGNGHHSLLNFPPFEQLRTKNAQCLIFYFVNYLNHHENTNIVFLEAFEERLQTNQITLAQMHPQTSGQRKLQTTPYTISARIQISSATIAYWICNYPHIYILSDVKPVYFREFTKYIQANRGELHYTAINDVWTNCSHQLTLTLRGSTTLSSITRRILLTDHKSI